MKAAYSSPGLPILSCISAGPIRSNVRRRNSEETAVVDCVKMLRRHGAHTLPTISHKACTFPQLQGSLPQLNGSMSMPLETIASVDALDITTEQEIKDLIQTCATNINYEILVDTESTDDSDVPDALSRLIGIARRGLLADMDDAFYIDLLNMIRANIFHRTTRIDQRLMLVDVPVKFQTRNARRLQLVYELFEVACPLLSRFIQHNDINNLLQTLESPAQSEQTLALHALETVLVELPNFTEFVVNHALRVIERCRDRCNETPFVACPLLMFLTRYYQKKIEQTDVELFKKIIYATFSSPDVHFFNRELGQVSFLFQMRDVATALWCFRFLLKHWPRSSAEKQVIFLQQLRCILSTLPPSVVSIIHKELFQILGESVASENYRVALCAMDICGDEMLIETMVAIAQPFMQALEGSLEAACGHWNDCVRAAAQKLSRILAGSFGQPKRRVIVTPKGNLRLSWDSIAAMAGNDRLALPSAVRLNAVPRLVSSF